MISVVMPLKRRSTTSLVAMCALVTVMAVLTRGVVRNSHAGPSGKGKGKANETRNKRAASKPPGRLAMAKQSKAKKAAPKKKKTKAAKEHRALISEIERMRGRGGTNMTTGIKGSGLRDIKVSTQRWLDSKKSTNHPLVHGPPMCDVVHELRATRVAHHSLAQ
jgi:hypothetical protein